MYINFTVFTAKVGLCSIYAKCLLHKSLVGKIY